MKAIFIDRDGVINRDPGGWTKHDYVTDFKDFHFLPGVFEAIRLLCNHKIAVIIVSNQAGVSKGYFTKERLDEINERMLKELSRNGGRIEAAYYCHHRNEDNCDCRKPKTGMLERAARKYNIDFHETYFIGDGQVDVEAGARLGVKTVLVLSGKTSSDDARKWRIKPDYIFRDLLEAVKWLMEKERRRALRARVRQPRVKGPE